MFTPIRWEPQKGYAKADGKERYYGAVMSADPERIRLPRWEIRIGGMFSGTLRLVRSATDKPEFWHAGVIVSKRGDGELAVTWARFNPLTGWPDGSGWTCWGGAVLAQAVWQLENEETAKLDSGRTFSVWPDEVNPGYVRLLETHIPTANWPLRADEGRRDHEDE